MSSSGGWSGTGLGSCGRGSSAAGVVGRDVAVLRRLILEEGRPPAVARYLRARFTGLKRDLAHYLDEYNLRRVHNGRLTRGRIPADIAYCADKVTTR